MTIELPKLLTPKELSRLLQIHLRTSREISKRLLKSGKDETSTLIKHKVVIDDGVPHFRTTVLLLPIRRMRKDIGGVLIEDGMIMHDLEEDGLV